MTRQNLPHIVLAAAALVFGAALLPVSASAQTRNPNDGGPVAVAPGATLDGGSKAAPTQAYYGRNANDGGTGPAPAQVSAATPKPSRKPAAPAPVHLGRAANDGGSTN